MANPYYFAVGVPIGKQYIHQKVSPLVAQVLVARDYVEIALPDYRVWLDALGGLKTLDEDIWHRLRTGNGQWPLMLEWDADTPDSSIMASYRLVPNGTSGIDYPHQHEVFTEHSQPYELDDIQWAIWLACWRRPFSSLNGVADHLSQSNHRDLDLVQHQVWQFLGLAMRSRLAYLLPIPLEVSA